MADPDGTFPIPAHLRSASRGAGEERRTWMAALPRLVTELCDRWALTLEAPFEPGGSCSWVAPGVSDHRPDDEVVLKITWSHTEARDEPAALRLLDGAGAVRLHAETSPDDVAAVAMLLERCRPGTSLATRPEEQQHPVITDLLREVWRTALPADHPFRPLTEMVDAWAVAAEAGLVAHPEVDPGLATDGLALCRELSRTAPDEVLLCTDLHAHNVIAANREPWLLIDPKPYVGDPHYDVVQHLINCPTVRTYPIGLVDHVADLAGLDRHRVRQWLFARCVQESLGDVPPWRDYATVVALLAPGLG